MLIVALAAVVAVAAGTAGETNAFSLPVPGVDDVAFPASALLPHSPRLSRPPRCALKYAAVLDLAELARRDGKSSSAYLHAFNHVTGQIDECGSSGGVRYASASFAVVAAAGGAGSAADE